MIKEYNSGVPDTRLWYTFVVNLDLNRGKEPPKGKNPWAVTVYRRGNTFQEAVIKINEDFDFPLVTFAAPGRIIPITGFRIEDLQFDPESPYKFAEQ